jgi:DNA invertase Pin-like site-specific DNA recombinase
VTSRHSAARRQRLKAHCKQDTTTPSGRAMFQMLGVFSEFERCMIQERVRAGLARVRAAGRRLGRPRIQADEEGIREAVAGGLSIRRTAQRFGVSAAKVQRVLSDEAARPAA